MKYVITGGAGHTSKPLALKLLAAGHSVKVLGRNAEHLSPLADQGAETAIGSLEDGYFVTRSFVGADAAWLILPPNHAAQDFRAYQRGIIGNYVSALRANRIGKVVVLSSVGAHLGKGAGPIDGVAELEKAITEELPATDALFLRPSFFFYNLFQQAGLARHMNVMGSNFAMNDESLFLVHTDDIAEAAFQALDSLSFTGKTILNLYSDERSTDEIAAVLGAGIGKPGIPWVAFPDEQVLSGMLQSGFTPSLANDYLQMGKALREGLMQADFRKSGAVRGKARLEDLLPAFTAFYQNQ